MVKLRCAALLFALAGAAGCSTADLVDIGGKAARGALKNACGSLDNCSNVCPDGTEAGPPAYSCDPGVRRPDLDRPKGT